jgi:GTP-binding protein HflX
LSQRCVVVGIHDKRRRLEAEDSLAELAALVRASGGDVVGSVLQARDRAERLGRGKAEEVRELARTTDAELVVTDWELRPAEARTLSDWVERPVLDRTEIILDIFATTARSREGRLQVEMAQLQYLLPRLVGGARNLSRTGGGIGTRGPGETRLETDRRRIRSRIAALRAELGELDRERQQRRVRRSRGLVPVVALVGYTNVGKSTLFQALTHRAAPVGDRPFVTLDALVRRIYLPGFGPALLADTVGLVRHLPHHLVEAFKSTLDEVRDADLLLIVSNAASRRHDEELAAVDEVLAILGADGIPSLLVENQWDRVAHGRAVQGVAISALTGANLDGLLAAMAERLSALRPVQEVLLSWQDHGVLDWIRAEGEVVDERPARNGEGLIVRFRAPAPVMARVARRLDAARREGSGGGEL